MSEQDSTQEDGTEQPQGGGSETFDADYVKKLRAEAAKYRKDAKANADAAARLAEIEEANKTEAQRQAERVTALEAEAQQARVDALRFKIAAKFQVSDEDADLFLTGTDEESLTKQAERLAVRAEEAGRPRSPKPDPTQGVSGATRGSTADQFAAAIEGHFTR